MRLRSMLILPVLLLLVAACGGGDDGGDTGGGTETTQTGGGDDTTTTAGDGGTGATAQILGEDTAFATGDGGASDLDADVNDRECGLTEVLFGSCRASTGAGGPFLVTAEGDPAAPGEWNVVVRCGLQPAEPVASARGTFQPAYTDLGLAPYGEVIGMNLSGADEAEGALIYQPEGSDCPVVWGLGPIKPSNLFLGGTDRLSGDEQPIQFTRLDGTTACAVADDAGGIEVSAASGDDCGA